VCLTKLADQFIHLLLYLLAGHVGKSGFRLAAQVENRSDVPGCMHKSLSRIWLFFRLRGRTGSAGDHILYRQQTLRNSCLPWSYPIAISSLLLLSCVGRVRSPAVDGRLNKAQIVKLFYDFRVACLDVFTSEFIHPFFYLLECHSSDRALN
jgi:hypothetical protein